MFISTNQSGPNSFFIINASCLNIIDKATLLCDGVVRGSKIFVFVAESGEWNLL